MPRLFPHGSLQKPMCLQQTMLLLREESYYATLYLYNLTKYYYTVIFILQITFQEIVMHAIRFMRWVLILKAVHKLFSLHFVAAIA